MIHYHVASTTLHESIDEEMVLLNLDSGEYFGLHANGRRFFEVLCKHSTIDDRVACLQSAYFQTRRPFRIWRRHLLVSPKTPIDRHCCTQLTELFRTLNRPVDTAAHRHIVRMTWLPKSLILQRMLARLDVAATIRTRLLTTAAKLQAHAWVELDSAMPDSRLDTAVRFHILDMKPQQRPAVRV